MEEQFVVGEGANSVLRQLAIFLFSVIQDSV